MLNKKALSATAAKEPIYIEDVFSTYLYTGNGGTNVINNGIDLAGEGGLVWLKPRSRADSYDDNVFVDTVRGATSYLASSGILATAAAQVGFGSPYDLSSFNNNGFTLGEDTTFYKNQSTITYASWSFRKAKKFFDIVTYTGNGVSSRTVNHNLGSVPGCIIIKRTDTSTNWIVWHRGDGTTNYNALSLNAIDASSASVASGDLPTSTTFKPSALLGSDYLSGNANGGTYVAYLFAHDAGGFGDSGSESVIKCGSYTGNGLVAGPSITLGWEPQLLIIKRATGGTADWVMHDNVRGIPDSAYYQLKPNSTEIEATSITSNSLIKLTSTGFQTNSTGSYYNANGSPYIYIAIRRGPMKQPSSGTEVFSATARNASSTAVITTGFPIDMVMAANRSRGFNETIVSDRLRGTDDEVSGGKRISTNTTNNEESDYGQAIDRMTGFVDKFFNTAQGLTSSTIYWSFKRAPGFFDIVCWTGNGGASQSITHNLGVTPELIISKNRTTTNDADWMTYHASIPTKTVFLNTTSAGSTVGNVWSPTSTTFTADKTNLGSNASGVNYVTYLFATLAGISKVGSYTGTGTTQQINCGFTSSARLVIIKRTDSFGDWYIWDYARGIVSGNDPYLLLNNGSTAEVTNTDYIDTYSSGFEISSTAPAAINANGGTFIYLAIA